MITDRFGLVVAQVKLMDFATDEMTVRMERDGVERVYPLAALHADGGIREIMEAAEVIAPADLDSWLKAE
jgi:hypothetical protein